MLSQENSRQRPTGQPSCTSSAIKSYMYKDLTNRRRDLLAYQKVDTRELVDLESQNASRPTSTGFLFRLRSWRKLTAIVGATLLIVTLLGCWVSPLGTRRRMSPVTAQELEDAIYEIKKTQYKDTPLTLADWSRLNNCQVLTTWPFFEAFEFYFDCRINESKEILQKDLLKTLTDMLAKLEEEEGLDEIMDTGHLASRYPVSVSDSAEERRPTRVKRFDGPHLRGPNAPAPLDRSAAIKRLERAPRLAQAYGPPPVAPASGPTFTLKEALADALHYTCSNITSKNILEQIDNAEARQATKLDIGISKDEGVKLREGLQNIIDENKAHCFQCTFTSVNKIIVNDMSIKISLGLELGCNSKVISVHYKRDEHHFDFQIES